MEDNNTIYSYRNVARIVIEAITPLALSSGEKDIVTDSLVALDVNGLPYIPGTSIAGVVRHALGIESDKESFFGYQKPFDSKQGKGSEIIFSEAKMIGCEGKVIDGLQQIDWSNQFYQHFKELPIRQHARINHQGVTADTGKFDEQVVFKGTRFCFEIEMISKVENDNQFTSVLSQIKSNTFRLGGGTRSGFGELKVVSCQTKDYDLCKKEDLESYLKKTSNLSDDWEYTDNCSGMEGSEMWSEYKLTLTPEDFFLFGSGFGDDDVDMTPVKEAIITWNEKGIPDFKGNTVLMPATSLKGALAHRVAYHYNRLNKCFADQMELADYKKIVGKNNEAVKTLFGSEGEKDGKKMKDQLRGNILFSDIIEEYDVRPKILNHVAIDRFTGGAIDGALFSEKTIYGKHEYTTTLYVNKDVLTGTIKEAFEDALKDLCTGMLPLGGGVNRGNGIFTGALLIDGEDKKWD